MKPARTSDERVDVRARRALADGLDERAEQRRRDEAGGRGERVQPDDARERAAVPAREAARMAPQLGPSAIGSSARHSLSPRVTVVAVRVARAEQLAVRALARPPSRRRRTRRGRPGRGRAGSSSRSPSSGRSATRGGRGRCAPRCARRPRSSARRARGSPGRREARGRGRAAGAGRRRTSGRARRPRRRGPPGSASRMSCAFATASASRIAVSERRSAPRVELAAEHAREQDRILLADDDPAPHGARAGAPRAVGRRAARHARPRGARAAPRSPSRRREPAETMHVSRPGSTTTPERSSTSGDAGLGLGARRVRARRRLGRRRAPPIIRRAPTSARVILSTASAAVRSGITRNAA